MYKDTKFYKDAKLVKNIKIIRIEQELHGTNAARFKHLVYKLSGVKPGNILIKLKQGKLKNQHNFKAALGLVRKNADIENKTENVKERSEQTLEKTLSKYTKHLSSRSNKTATVDQKSKPFRRSSVPSYVFETRISMSGETNENCIEYENKDEAVDTLSDINYINEDLNIVRLPFKYLIIDCSPINFIDTSGVRTLQRVLGALVQ